MKCLGLEFECRTRHFTVVIVTMTIMIALLALVFGLAAARSVPEEVILRSSDTTKSDYEPFDVDSVKRKIDNSSLFETTYEGAVQLLTKYPVVDG